MHDCGIKSFKVFEKQLDCSIEAHDKDLHQTSTKTKLVMCSYFEALPSFE